MKYILGTAQFGLDYGVSNSRGRVSDKDLIKIFGYADNHGVQYLDTANVYGNSEDRIGKLFELTRKFDLITKTAHTKASDSVTDKISLIKNELVKSLQKMKRSAVDILLIHNLDDILGPDGGLVFQALEEIKAAGLTKKIGVSVYTVEEAETIFSNYPIDVLQFPLNVFDQSFDRSGILKKLKINGVELHARSVFLQGLLLMPNNDLDVYFDRVKPIAAEYFDFLKGAGLSKVEGALNYLKQVKEVDAVVFGVQDTQQLAHTLSSLESPPVWIDYMPFAIFDRNITNPSLWEL